jgi:Domain of unknown function (DUF6431)
MSCGLGSAVIVARTTELAEQLLTGGDLRCPRCGDGQLTAWGYGRRRTIRSHGTATVTIRPRRTRCVSCLSTHVVMPAALQPRHADTTAVIGTALLHKANGLGHRRIAVAIDRPVSTVRRWLRRLPPAHLDRIHRDGVQRLLRLDPDTFTALRYDGNMLRHALSVLSGHLLGPTPMRHSRPALDPDRYVHPRPTPGPTRLTVIGP